MSGKIAVFLRTTEQPDPKDTKGKNKLYTVPGVRFQWGTFLFDGVLESMNETLDLWSEDGRPLRSTVSISLSQPGIHNLPSYNPKATAPAIESQAATAPGTKKPTPAPEGKSLQGLVAGADAKRDWKEVAADNGIENPRHIPTGTPLDLEGIPKAPPIPLRPPGMPGSPPSGFEFTPFEEAKELARINARASISATGAAPF